MEHSEPNNIQEQTKRLETHQSQDQIIQPVQFQSTKKKGKFFMLIIIMILMVLVALFWFIFLTPLTSHEPLVVTYIWEGKLPGRHVEKMKRLKYPFRIILNCDIYLQLLEQQLHERFSDKIYSKVNEKTDVCKFAFLYIEGGLYQDLDTQLEYECMQRFLEDKNIFFQANPVSNGADFFTIYSKKPGNQNLIKALKYQNTFRSFSRYHSLLVSKMDKKSYVIQKSGCVKHLSEGSWIKKI